MSTTASQPSASGTDAASAPSVLRIEVTHSPSQPDPRAQALLRLAAELGLPLEEARVTQVYLIEGPLTRDDAARIARTALASPILEEWALGARPPSFANGALVEVHPLPGVMDPAAQTVRDVIRDLTGVAAEVTTGKRYDLAGLTPEQALLLARQRLANPVVHAIHTKSHHPDHLPRGLLSTFTLRRIEIRDLSDDQLERLSRDAHLFLSLEEMQAIRAEYRLLKRDPTDIELETLAQTWSEHCVHKTLKSRITYRSSAPSRSGRGQGESFSSDPLSFSNRPGHTLNPDGSVTIDNLLKSTVAAATFELIKEGVDWTLSVFKDNSGVIAFDETTAVCIKVETHNHPSAIEPYGGAATGAGGCIRDVIGTGLGAKPIANTDVFCVAFPDRWSEPGAAQPSASALPAGCLHPRRVLTDVVAGVRDYGNRMGIPTVNGAVWFDDRHIGNPLVFCGCVGVMPRDRVKGGAKPGDLIVALGGRTGRDGIHGATFSSAELTDTHADEFAHAVQIGNAIEEKKVLDAILRCRDAQGGPLYSGLTDCGAGGFSSAVGEMGAEIGAEVHLDRAPLKYDGLTYTEIWISEAQERMVLAVPQKNLARLKAICAEEGVEVCELGVFGPPHDPEAPARVPSSSPNLTLFYNNVEVGRLPMRFLHDGIPTPTREAVWAPRSTPHSASSSSSLTVPDTLFKLLSHPNIASKRWIVRQYDHEVQGQTVLKPLVGPTQDGPGDASVITPVPLSKRALAVGCGLATGVGDPALPGGHGDPYLMALSAIDECVRNLVCVGADPDRIAILDNFCWPSCKKPENLASLVRAAEGCYDGAKAFRTPFVSGKDSLNNQFTTEDGVTIEIPPTLLITGIGHVHDRARCVTMDAKRAGNALVLVGETRGDLGGSHLQRLTGAESPVPRVDLAAAPRAARAVAGAIRAGLVRSAHDCSDGGLLVAVAEMLIAAEGGPGVAIGAALDFATAPGLSALEALAFCFAETPSRYVLEVAPEHERQLAAALAGVPHSVIGRLDDSGMLTLASAGMRAPVADLKRAWLKPLDW